MALVPAQKFPENFRETFLFFGNQMDNTKEAIEKDVERMVSLYQTMRENVPSMYESAMWDYASLANGGTGHTGHEVEENGIRITIRQKHYEGYPDSFFFLVLTGLGEIERYYDVVEAEARDRARRKEK